MRHPNTNTPPPNTFTIRSTPGNDADPSTTSTRHTSAPTPDHDHPAGHPTDIRPTTPVDAVTPTSALENPTPNPIF